MDNKLTREEFIRKAKSVHGDKYIYTKTDLEHRDEKGRVCIICPIHGEFWQTPNNHLSNHGCPYCWKERRGKNRKLTKDEFIERARKIHGNKYDYSKMNYSRLRDKVLIICPIHGEFWQEGQHHLKGCKCPKCAIEENGKNKFKGTENFIEESKKIHGNKYDYSKVNYKGCYEKVCIICPKHGEFWQLPYCHLQGQGCPNCQNSNLENKTKVILDSLNIKNIQRCDKSYFKWLGKQHLDFYLPEYNIAIECQGIQHYEPIEYFGGVEKLDYVKKLDKRKKVICVDHNIKLYFIKYDEDIKIKLSEILRINKNE